MSTVDDDMFWQIISTLQGSVSKNSMDRFAARLKMLSPGEVEEFGETLAQRLYDLDTLDHFHQPVRADIDEPEDLSADLFLDLRCAVVVAGRAVYEEVSADPTALGRRRWPTLWDAASLIDTLNLVYAATVPGQDGFGPSLNIETGSNSQGFQDAASKIQLAEPTQMIGVRTAWTMTNLSKLGLLTNTGQILLAFSIGP